MNRKLSTTLIAAALAGGGIVGAGSLVANAANGYDAPSSSTSTQSDTNATTPTDGDGVNGLVAQVDTPTDTATPTDTEPADTATPNDDAAPNDGAGGERRGGPRGEHGCHGISPAVADLLGLTPDQVRDARESGSSLAEIATRQGVSVDDLIQAMIADKADHINTEVDAGELTQDEADQRLADLTARVTEEVNHTDDS